MITRSVFDDQMRGKSLGNNLWSVSSAIYNSWMTGILKPILRNLLLVYSVDNDGVDE